MDGAELVLGAVGRAGPQQRRIGAFELWATGKPTPSRVKRVGLSPQRVPVGIMIAGKLGLSAQEQASRSPIVALIHWSAQRVRVHLEGTGSADVLVG